MKELGITKGEYKLTFHYYPTKPKRICTGVGINEEVLGGTYTTMICDSILPDTDAEYIKQSKRIEAEMKLFADAGNTAQKCGLLPSELLQQRDELKEALAEQKRLYFSLFDEEINCMYCEAKIRRGSAIILCKECAENTEV